jgi:hypothetical protein
MWEMVYACKILQKPSKACDKQSTLWEGSQRSVLTTNLCILEVTAPLICRSFLLLYVLDTLSLVLLWVLDAYNKISEVFWRVFD